MGIQTGMDQNPNDDKIVKICENKSSHTCPKVRSEPQKHKVTVEVQTREISLFDCDIEESEAVCIK